MKQKIAFMAIVGCLTLQSQTIKAQITSKKINTDKLPSSLKYKGKIVEGVEWKDKKGDNILLLTTTGLFIDADPETYRNSCELYAYHFIKTDKEWKMVWQLTDFIRECDLDIILDFKKNTLSITDLNKNNIAESWIMYEMSCKGDVSPNDLKLIMHEGEKKYAIRGSETMYFKEYESTEKTVVKGEKNIDSNFKNGPAVFLEFANTLWNKNSVVDTTE